jgi:glyoxylase-like metal-dependent hydrolase (beta-lactamase superfamily II)/8-oxo-dGTP pyrophosphatase MutT (NUDIX family)
MSDASDSGNLYEALLEGLAKSPGPDTNTQSTGSTTAPATPTATAAPTAPATAKSAAAPGATAPPRDAAKPPAARASASVILWRQRPGPAAGGGSPGVEVYWVQRSEALAFMGGWHAFPGGAVARTDAEIPVLPPAPAPDEDAPAAAEAPDPAPAAVPAGGGSATPDLMPGVLACALRELFEETGILLARREEPESAPQGNADSAAPVGSSDAAWSDRLAAARAELLADSAPAAAAAPAGTAKPAATAAPTGTAKPAAAGISTAPALPAGTTALPAAAAPAGTPGAPPAKRGFGAILQDLGCVAEARRLVYAGRWLTPPFAPLRFDNRFFLLEWPAEEAIQPEVLPGELASGEWIDPAAAWRSWHQGETLAAPPILHALQVLGTDGPRRGLPRLRRPVEGVLGPLLRVELRPGVLMFPLATRTLPPALTTNAYLLGFGDCILVDPGAPTAPTAIGDPTPSPDSENDRLAAALAAAHGQLGRRVVAIWLTHHHPDHVSGVPEMRQRLGVPVLAHPLTAERLATHGLTVDGELHDGQRIVLPGLPGRPGLPGQAPDGADTPDMEVQVVYTPGHARGHLCFLELGQRSLLAGDLIAGLGTIVVDPPEGNMDDYLASLAKLIDLAPRTLFPGHGPAVKNAIPKLREYIDHRLWREQLILTAWRQGHRDPDSILPLVYNDTPPAAHPLARRQILAHLDRLKAQGHLAAD